MKESESIELKNELIQKKINEKNVDYNIKKDFVSNQVAKCEKALGFKIDFTKEDDNDFLLVQYKENQIFFKITNHEKMLNMLIYTFDETRSIVSFEVSKESLRTFQEISNINLLKAIVSLLKNNTLY